MQAKRTPKRPAGTGALFIRTDQTGRETWYGKWRDPSGRQVKQKIGPKRTPGTRDGLTRTQAEKDLRRRIDTPTAAVARGERMTVETAGRALVDRKESQGRARATVQAYDSLLRVHLAPYFGARTLDKIDRRDVQAFMAHMRASGSSVKTVLNVLGLLHGIFDLAQREGWATSNPCKLVDKPAPVDADADVRFLEPEEIEALLRATPDTALGRVERVMYLAAAMTGMRQGELMGLRWRDVDWDARKIRVRQAWVRGEFKAPKSRRGTRAVPLIDRLAGELDRLYQASDGNQADDDLVFAHPLTGKPIDRSKLLKRYKAALKRGGVREVRFHDLRHTFGTRMAAAGTPMRTLQELMGHRDFKTTLIYADYAPNSREGEWAEAAFRLPEFPVAAVAS